MSWIEHEEERAATEALQAVNEHKSPGARDLAKKFLLRVLADGPVPAVAIEDAAKAEGVSVRTLARAKAGAGHGKWLPLLRERTGISQQRANEYMRLAAGLDKLPPGGNLKDALRLLSDSSNGPMVAADGEAACEPNPVGNKDQSEPWRDRHGEPVMLEELRPAALDSEADDGACAVR